MILARVLAIVAAALALLAGSAAAEIGPALVLEGIEIERAAGAWEIQVAFGTLARYLRHAPASEGDTLAVQISPIVMSPADAPALASPQSLSAPRGTPVPLLDVTYEPAGHHLVLRFSRPVRYSVRPRRDLRGLTVAIPDAPAARPTPPPPSPPPMRPTARAPATTPGQPPSTTARAPEGGAPAPPPPPAAPAAPSPALAAPGASLLETARAALTAGDADQAIRVLTKLLSQPEGADSREAKELLGLARERRGQLAHARAEYEEYLALHPDGEGAARVRQRLDALLTARAKLPPPRGATGAPAAAREREIDVFGSVYSQYRREVRAGDSYDGTLVADSSLFSDALLVARLRTPGWTARAQTAGSQLFQLADGSSGNQTRVSSAFVDAQQREGPWAGTFGRQAGNTGGVYGRLDGLRARRRVAKHWSVGVGGGMPVEYWRSQTPDPSRYLYGLSLDADRLFERVDGQLYLVQQRADGFVDRTAAGLELRYADRRLFGAGFLDYDLYYASLNTAMLTGNWQIDPRTGLHAHLDYRNSPILTTRNALIGQGEDRLDQLDGLSRREIEQLAEDRTARSTLFSVGGTRQLGERFQAALDLSLSRLDGTPGSGGVEETDDTGWETSVHPQLIATDLFTAGEVTTLGVRWFRGSTAETWSLLLHERYPVSRRLRLLPRLRFDIRTQEGRDEFALRPDDPDSDLPAIDSANRVRSGAYTLRPFLALEYRLGRFTVDSDAGVEWTFGSFSESESTGAPEADELAWILNLGLRYDF